jgi:hypothetical protein
MESQTAPASYDHTWIPIDSISEHVFTNPTPHEPSPPVTQLPMPPDLPILTYFTQQLSEWEQQILPLADPIVLPSRRLAAGSDRQWTVILHVPPDSYRSYSWAVAAGPSILWIETNNVQGKDPSPLRRSLQALLSAVIMTNTLMTYYSADLHQSPTQVFYTVPALLHTYNKSINNETTPNPFLPEFDVILELRHYLHSGTRLRVQLTRYQTTLQQLPRGIPPNFHDTVAKLSALPPRRKNHAPIFMPHCHVYVETHGQVLTKAEVLETSKAPSTKIIQKYFRDKYKIELAKPSPRSWQTRARTISKLPYPTRKFLVKALARWLPVGHRLHKVDPSTPAICPYCSQTEHLLLCNHQDEWRDETLSTIEKVLLREKTVPRLQQMILNQLDVWFHTPRPPEESPESRKFYLTFCGILPQFWVDMQQRSFAKLHHKLHADKLARRWSIALCSTLVNAFHTLWKIRCEKAHSKDQLQNSHQRSLLLAKIKDLYLQAQALPQSDRALFDRPVDSWTNTSNQTLMAWIQLATKTIQCGRKLIKQQNQMARAGMRRFLMARA